MSQIPKITTTEYPTRYVAFDRINTIVEQEDTSLKNGGREIMVYYEPWENSYHQKITDGIYTQIISYQRIKYLAEINSTRPNKWRKQKNEHFMSESPIINRPNSEKNAYESAYEWILKKIPEHQQFVRSGAP